MVVYNQGDRNMSKKAYVVSATETIEKTYIICAESAEEATSIAKWSPDNLKVARVVQEEFYDSEIKEVWENPYALNLVIDAITEFKNESRVENVMEVPFKVFETWVYNLELTSKFFYLSRLCMLNVNRKLQTVGDWYNEVSNFLS